MVGASISVSHGLYGIVYRVLNIAGVVDIDGRPFDVSADRWEVWDLALFEPWFLVEGILFVGMGWAALMTSHDRRRWLGTCAFGVTIATLSGLLRVRFA